MKFRIRKIFPWISLSIVGLVLFLNLTAKTANAQATPPANRLEQCSLPKDSAVKLSDVSNETSVIRNSNDPIETRLGDRIRVTIDGLTDAVAKDSQISQQLVLQLDGYPLKGVHGNLVDKDQLVFQITHNEESRNEWNAILGAAWNLKRENIKVTVGCPDGQQIPVDSATLSSNRNKITILLWQNYRMLIVLLPLALIVFFLSTKSFRDALRGSGRSSNRVYSLAKFQTAWWSYLIFFTFLGLFALTGTYTNIVTAQSMVLLGISTVTTIGSAVVDGGEDRQLTQRDANTLELLDDWFLFLNAMKSKTKGDDKRSRIFRKLTNNLDPQEETIKQLLAELDFYTPEADIPVPVKPQPSLEPPRPAPIAVTENPESVQGAPELGAEPENLTPISAPEPPEVVSVPEKPEPYRSYEVLLKKIERKEFNLLNLKKAERTHVDVLLAETKKAMSGIEQQSQNFVRDVLTNPNGEVNLHRYQMFIWTIVLGLVFIYEVLTTFKMPEFDTTLLALQGLSSGTFVALKAQEKPPGS